MGVIEIYMAASEEFGHSSKKELSLKDMCLKAEL